MELSLPLLAGLLRETVTDPRGTTRRLVGMGLPFGVLWIALVVIAALSAILAHLTLTSILLRSPAGTMALPAPFLTAIMQIVVLSLMAAAVHQIGRWMGGTGQATGAMLMVVWLQFVLVCIQTLQLVTMFLLPPVAELLGLAALVLFFWLLTNFVAELHGFPSLLRVFVGVIISIVAVAFALGIVLTLFLGTGPGVR